MLEVRGLRVSYGAAPALSDLDLDVGAGELVGVVGPNGAGKTTLINTLAGLIAPASGRIGLNGTDLARLPSHAFCAAGVAIVPESRRLFSAMTVRENLELGSYLPRAKAERARSLESVIALFPALASRLGTRAGSLSGGQQQMVAIGRALMARPSLLLLDEPSLGLAPAVVETMFAAVRRINAAGVAILLVEQNIGMAMELASRAYVLEEGRVVLQGQAAELMGRPEIRKAYLGLE
ncbi:MAG: ABC transporter ATP-binding protein [Alphaproteobacteria bacterium]|nr:ABC transporter ATP-binding protein [Alphaproteobacteria bacterium]